jgi:DNA-binding protein Fis
MSKTATLCVDRELRDELKVRSAIEKRSLQSLVENALRGYLKNLKGT